MTTGSLVSGSLAPLMVALRNKEVWATIKRDFKDVSIGTLVDVAKKLSEGYVKKKIDSLLNGERTFAGSNVKA